MKFYDLHVHTHFSEGESSLEDFARMAKKLGYSGFASVYYVDKLDELEELKQEALALGKKYGLDIAIGFKARNLKELRKLVRRRKSYELLFVKGGNLRLNRKAVETPEVDVLTHPEAGRNDPGLNHVMARLAAKNNVAIELNFRQILISSKKSRSKILAFMRRNLNLCVKYKAPVIVTSGAYSHWEMKHPLVLSSLAVSLGLDVGNAKKLVSKVPRLLLLTARERLDENWIMPGVKVVRR